MTTRVMRVGDLTADIVAQRPRVNIKHSISFTDGTDRATTHQEIDDILCGVAFLRPLGSSTVFCDLTFSSVTGIGNLAPDTMITVYLPPADTATADDDTATADAEATGAAA